MTLAPPSFAHCQRLTWTLAALGLAGLTTTHAQAQAPAPGVGGVAWQECASLQKDPTARLACFDQWSQQQAAPAGATSDPAGSAQTGAAPSHARSAVAEPMPPPATDAVALQIVEVPRAVGCRDAQFTALSRFWELENGTDCGTFSFRGYRPISVSATVGDNVNRQPSSKVEGHSADKAIDYQTTENRIQLSVRTKVAQGMLTGGDGTRKDSLWVGYTQQSYWQLFSSNISRPFRTTDHEPEVVYVYPTDVRLPLGWRLRYSGIGLAHQSNGQSLPLSRSWNRTYLMAGMEMGDRWTVQARIWKRIKEGARNDDNPDITDYIGRGELLTTWNPNANHTLALTLRHSLRQQTRGSARLEWLQTLGKGLGGGKSNLRFHTQLFTGYGDSLIDYNHKRTVLSVGLSLVDF